MGPSVRPSVRLSVGPSVGAYSHPPMALPHRSTAIRQMLVPTRFSPPHPYSLDEGGDAKQGGGEPGWGGKSEGRASGGFTTRS